MYMQWNYIALERFSFRLKILMYLHNEDNKSLAKLLNCKLVRISNFRSCAAAPKDNEVKILAEHYNVPINFMCGDSTLMLITEDRGGNRNLIYKDV